jgi:hypothetical protein
VGGNYFQEHKVRLYLDKDLYVAFIRLQADKTIGRSYAGLLPFVEGLYHMGYINKDVYQAHVLKYSEKLVTKKQLTLVETQEMEKNIQLARFFKAVAEQWEGLSPRQREAHLKKAIAARAKVPQAELIIQLAAEKPGANPGALPKGDPHHVS